MNRIVVLVGVLALIAMNCFAAVPITDLTTLETDLAGLISNMSGTILTIAVAALSCVAVVAGWKKLKSMIAG